jgi:hypothetical protein
MLRVLASVSCVEVGEAVGRDDRGAHHRALTRFCRSSRPVTVDNVEQGGDLATCLLARSNAIAIISQM